MAIHEVWSYDHVPPLGVDISTGTSLSAYSEAGTYNQQTGLLGMLYKNTSGTGIIGVDGFLTLTTASGSNPALLVQAKEVQDWSVATQYWLGFRTKTSLQNGAACNIFALSDSLTDTNFQALLQETDMTAASAAVLNTEYYVEIFIDRTNLVYQVWVNGVRIKNGSLTAAALPVNGNGYYWFGAYNSLSGVTNGATRSFRDFYFLDVDATTPSRLGSTRSSAQTISSATGSNYTSYEGILTGQAVISTAQGRLSSASLAIPAGSTGSGLLVPERASLHLTASWTIEGLCYMTNVTTDVQFVDKSLNSTLANRAWIEFNAQQVQYKLDASASASTIGSSSAIPGANQWFWIALVYNGTTLTLYINGVSVGTATVSGTWGNQAGNLVVGNKFDFGSNNFPGYIQELRISNIARYSGSSYTPSATPFVTDANTVLLMHLANSQGGLVSDDALSALAVLQQTYSSSSTTVQNPVTVNAPSNDNLTLGISNNYAQGYKILAMDFRLAARTPNAPASLTSTISQDGSNQSLGNLSISDVSMNYGRRLGLLTKAPDGGAWSPAKISATTIVLTPTS